MANKLNIQGELIGTTADNVEYGKNNQSTVEDALDALFAGQGGSQPSDDGDKDEVLALLESKFIVQGGVKSAQWNGIHYSQMRSNNHEIDNWQNGNVYFDPTSNFAVSGTSEATLRFRVYAGDVLHYHGLGNTYERPLVITDLNFKVLYAGDYIQSGVYAEGTYNIVEDGWVFAYAYLHGGKQNSYAYAQWTERKTVKNKPMYCCFGDSISTDSAGDQRAVAYPRILAGLTGAELYRSSQGGANINAMLEGSWLGYEHSRSDADIVTILYGANDCFQITENYPVGVAADVMELDIDSDYSSLMSTWIGKYRFVLEQILIRSPKAKIVCVSPIDMNTASVAETLADMRTQISALVAAINTRLGTNRLYYLDGKADVLTYNAYYYRTSDATHPNEIGQFVIAHNIYYKCVKNLLWHRLT